MDNTDPVLVMLRDDRESALPDGGFSQSVLRVLPPDPVEATRGRWVSAAALVAGTAATAMWAPLPEGAWASSGMGSMASMILVLGGAVAALACVVWAYVATDFLEPRQVANAHLSRSMANE